MSEDSFSEELQTRTRRQHDLSNTLVNLSAPLALSSPDVYRLLLVSWYWIYKTVETKMEHFRLTYPKVGAIYFPQLLRTGAFEDDLRFYYGSDFEKRIMPPSKATADYIKNFVQSIENDPVCIIAYCYTMYLGMFGGGPIVKRWVRSAFSLPPGKGTKIFEFSDTIPDIPKFKKEYKDAMDRIALSRDEKERIVEMKKQVFAHNDTIFAEIRKTATYNRRVISVVVKYALLFVVLLGTFRFLFDASFRTHAREIFFAVTSWVSSRTTDLDT
ncbi:unnamed protein product [Chondrus crispus]|uniref:Heme oxygenase n=1 Tax=Chondrus crispus TaxID=2769 RepID=R7QM45_CHOCR|nr:unnamed protein product [Chondrus crispus]CDF38541.1 unnamed protein product [Chondrus crispus]|eukprot:XP_005718434.1 unnamed protein product [Chondrus crispus]